MTTERIYSRYLYYYLRNYAYERIAMKKYAVTHFITKVLADKKCPLTNKEILNRLRYGNGIYR